MNLGNGIQKINDQNLWDLYNAKVHKGENIRAFPIPIGQRWMFGNISKEKT